MCFHGCKKMCGNAAHFFYLLFIDGFYQANKIPIDNHTLLIEESVT